MATYIIRRFIQGFIVLVLATFVIYSILVVTPGGPADQVAELKALSGSTRPVNAAYLENVLKAYKLDSPYPINYLRWLFDPSDTIYIDRNDGNAVKQKGIDIKIGDLHIKGSGALTGDFGNSLVVQKGTSVMQLMGDKLGNTLALTVSALLVSVLIAFPVGVIAAIRQYSRLDYAVTAFSFVGLSMPTFWLGLMLVIFTGVLAKQAHDTIWPWMPYLPTGFASDTDQEDNIVNRVYHLILPVAVLAFVNVASYSRYVRSSMLEVMRQDYVRTAWAKGLAHRSVIMRHALRNALIPVITVLTLSLPFLFSGAIVTEQVFSYPGMGKLFITAIFGLDIPLIMAFLLIITTLIVLSNILADVLYAVADPRIHYS
jgi:peptide/nickel transport system permease protein